jgi:hypothetical protein
LGLKIKKTHYFNPLGVLVWPNLLAVSGLFYLE